MKTFLKLSLAFCALFGLAVIVAGGLNGLKTGMHTKMTGTIGDLYLTLAAEVFKTDTDTFPTAGQRLSAIV